MKIFWQRKPSGQQNEFHFHSTSRPVWLLIFTAGNALNNQRVVCSMPPPLLHDLKLVMGYLWDSDSFTGP